MYQGSGHLLDFKGLDSTYLLEIPFKGESMVKIGHG